MKEDLEFDENDYDEDYDVNSCYLTGYAKEYKEKISKELIPLYNVMGNDVLYGQFNGNPEEVYKYCLEHNKRWEEVLGYKEDPEAIY